MQDRNVTVDRGQGPVRQIPRPTDRRRPLRRRRQPNDIRLIAGTAAALPGGMTATSNQYDLKVFDIYEI